jgi:hypothetical protein
MQRLLFIFLFFFCFVNHIIAQKENEIHLSREQMYEDFDQFLEMVQNHTPRFALIKSVTVFDAIIHLSRQRKKIESIKTAGEFYQFIEGLTRCLLDPHAFMIKYNSVYPSSYMFKWSLNTIDTLKMQAGISFFRHYLETNDPLVFSLGNYLVYHDGRYRVIGNVMLGNGFDSVILDNTELVKIGNYSVDDFVRFFPEQQQGTLRWDFNYKKYYAFPLCVPAQELTFRDISNGKTIIFDNTEYRRMRLGNHKSIEVKDDKYLDLVEYFKKEHILYIFIPANTREYGDYILSRIPHVVKHKRINKVILDVRGNSGGSDQVWLDILSCLSKDTICIYRKVAIPNQPEMLKTYLQEFNISQKHNIISIAEQDFIEIVDSVIVVPARKSMSYSGHFYVIQDCETGSSAHSLSSICRHTPRFTSIGTPTGWINGWGGGSYFFQLQHSGITCAMTCDLEISAIRNMVDYYQDIPEIEVCLSLEDLKNMSWKLLRYKKKLQQDPCFRKVKACQNIEY